MEQRRSEGDLKFDLLATQDASAWQHFDLVEGAHKLLYGFDQRGAM